jgi:hypothetical protein
MEQESNRARKRHDAASRMLRPRTFTCGHLISCSPPHPLSLVPLLVVADLAIQADAGRARALLEEAPATLHEKSQDANGPEDNA